MPQCPVIGWPGQRGSSPAAWSQTVEDEIHLGRAGHRELVPRLRPKPVRQIALIPEDSIAKGLHLPVRVAPG